ncbi:MAG TPA: alpha/beta hydrolase-fold protein [Anaerolineales bacterium]|nr:alpha/beta hydrolase-fold protein [Anaerolineales bacterium]
MTASNSKIRRARESGNPVIDGNEVTFFWEGRSAPTLISDANNWDEQAKPFKRVSPRLRSATTKSVWYCTLHLPRDAYVEYAFYDPVTQVKFLDPLNRRTVSNGLGSRNNFFYMPQTMPSPFSVRRADVPVGALTNHRVETRWLRDDYEREIFLYRPPVRKPVPLVVVYDGQDYLQRGKLASMVDNLMADGRIQPIAMAFLPNAGRWRSVEYACSDATLLWLDQVVLPLAKEKLNLVDVDAQPGAFGVLGASLGGTMSLYTGLRMPDVFGRVLTQSGAFMIEGRDFAVVDLVRHGQAQNINIWMDVGQLDVLLADNQKMHSLLQEKNYLVTYREFSGGHNYTAWRDDLWRGLEAMFPGR